MRHECSQQDEMQQYAWMKHDGRTYGYQTLKDGLNNIKLTTEFLKLPGGDHGGHWAVKVSGERLNNAETSVITLLYYLGMDHDGKFHGANLDIEENVTSVFIHYSIVLFLVKRTILGNFP